MIENGEAERMPDEWVSTGSLAGFYRIEHPEDWTVVRDENTVTLVGPNASGTVTIAAFHGGPLQPDTLLTFLRRAVQPAVMAEAEEEVAKSGWEGFQQRFRQEETGRAVLALIAQRNKVFALVTASDDTEQFELLARIYRRILSSLTLVDPQLDLGWPG